MTGALAILGAGGHARVVADCAERLGYDDIVFFDDRPDVSVPEGWRLGGTGEALLAGVGDFDGFVVGIGDNRTRLKKHAALIRAGGRAVRLIHPAAWVSARAHLGVGTVVFAGAVVNIGARLGEAVIINTGATVDHDCVLGDGVHISPGAHLAGGVTVGRESWVGIGAAVREGVTIGHQVCIGAGAVVVKSIADGQTVVGNPARPLER